MTIKLAEERKILKICNSFLITLPQTWMLNLGLKKGDKISCEIDGDKNLVIKPIGVKNVA